MKPIRSLSLIVLIILSGMPLTAQTDQTPDIFDLPEGVAGEVYRANIEAVLRETYRLKLETNARASAFRWTLAEGEFPAGLLLRMNGAIVGTPRFSRTEPYRFAVKVTDLSLAGSEGLKLYFSVAINAPRIRLTRINAPRIVPIDSTGDEGHHTDNAGNRAKFTFADSAPSAHRDSGSEKVTASESSSLRSNSGGNENTNPSTLRNNSEPRLSVPTAEPVAPASNPIPTVEVVYKGRLLGPAARGSSGSLNSHLPFPVPTPVVIDPSKEQSSGDKIRGPATIELRNLNVLRYDIRIGKEVTFVGGPDLKLPFIPPIPNQPATDNLTAPAVAGGAKNASASNPIRDRFNNLVGELNAIEGEKVSEVNNPITTATTDANTAKADLEALVGASDSILTTPAGPQAIIDTLPQLVGTAATPGGTVEQALNNAWPDLKIDNLLGRLDILKNKLLTLPTTPVTGSEPTWSEWYVGANKSTYDATVARVGELQTQLNGLKSSGPQGVAFLNAQNKLRLWKPILIGVRDGGVAGFNRSVKVGCGFAFDNTKETKVKIARRDRLADPGTNPTLEEVVTVVCSSPLSVSAGFGFSNIDEKEFVFVPSTKTTTNASGQTTTTVISRFGFKNKSSFRTLPVLLLNTRIWEPSDKIAVHVSTGAAVDVKTGQGGTDLEYIVGPSISFWRSLFITPGLHIGRVPKLAGGFSLDEEVPTGISEPPLEKAWKKGFVTTFTYKIH